MLQVEDGLLVGCDCDWVGKATFLFCVLTGASEERDSVPVGPPRFREGMKGR